MKPDWTLADWLAHCERLHARQIDLALDRVAAVRDRLGLRFNMPVISVAGTNGKGSSCALIDAIARAAGWRVGLYSKPHLVDFEERCRIDGRNLDASALLPHFETVRPAPPLAAAPAPELGPPLLDLSLLLRGSRPSIAGHASRPPGPDRGQNRG